MTRWLLRGAVAGAERSYRLAGAELRVGRSEDCEVVIPDTSVSLVHATVRVEPDGLVVSDQGSKNGTWVNGRSASATLVREGETVAFGPVELTVDQVPDGDERLVATFSHPARLSTFDPGPAAGDYDPTISGWSPNEAERWLAFADRFAARLSTGTPRELSTALEQLVAEVGAAAAGVVLWRDAGPATVRAAVGDAGRIVDVVESPALAAAITDCRRSRTPAVRTFDGGSVGLLPLEDRAVLVLAVLGDDRLELPVGGVRLLARLCAARLGAPMPPPAAEVESELVFPDGYIRGGSPAALRLERDLRIAAPGNHPVLLLGETGVGKEVVARLLHASSPRAGKAWIALNCAALPADLLEAELFGVVRGVATGVEPRTGLFQQADGGTLFLDEIGELPLVLQPKLLRALQNGEVRPLGGGAVHVDIRIVGATNVGRDKLFSEGEFRRDLYYRLAGDLIEVPPLRERREDIPLFVNCLGEKFARETSRGLLGVTARAMRHLVEYPWPGNVRELETEMRRAVLRSSDRGVLDSSSLSPAIVRPESQENAGAGVRFTNTELAANVRDLESRLIRHVLELTEGNRSLAARRLGIARNTLAAKVRQYGIEESP